MATLARTKRRRVMPVWMRSCAKTGPFALVDAARGQVAGGFCLRTVVNTPENQIVGGYTGPRRFSLQAAFPCFAATAAAALRITSMTRSGWDNMMTWLLFASTVVAPMRFA